MANINDMLDFYQIKLGDDGIKRVQELQVLRQHAVEQADLDQVDLIDQELNQLYR